MKMYRKPITIGLEVNHCLLPGFLLMIAVGLFSSEGLAQESTHVTVSPVIGLPGDEVSLPIYLETAPGAEVGSIALEIIFPHNLLSFLNAHESFLTTTAGGRLAVEVKTRDEWEDQSVARLIIEAAQGEPRTPLPDGQLGFVAFQISTEAHMSTKIPLQVVARVMDMGDPAQQVEPIVAHDGEISVGNLLFACFFYLH
ncbi:MAG: hypothetical protein IIB03_05845 [Acidobacteria bacterium]|nr:hypothetical protein [Acidobacteriota bacterium]